MLKDAEITEYRQEGRNSLREDVRAIMRGEDVDSAIAQDLLREVTEWHDAGRPDDRGTAEHTRRFNWIYGRREDE